MGGKLTVYFSEYAVIVVMLTSQKINYAFFLQLLNILYHFLTDQLYAVFVILTHVQSVHLV